MKGVMMITVLNLLIVFSSFGEEKRSEVNVNEDIPVSEKEAIANLRSRLNNDYPFSEVALVQFEMPEKQEVRAKLTAADGSRTITVFNGTVNANELHTFAIGRGSFAPGMYFFVVTAQDGTTQAVKVLLTQ